MGSGSGGASPLALAKDAASESVGQLADPRLSGSARSRPGAVTLWLEISSLPASWIAADIGSLYSLDVRSGVSGIDRYWMFPEGLRLGVACAASDSIWRTARETDGLPPVPTTGPVAPPR